jgi:hypothetical protein
LISFLHRSSKVAQFLLLAILVIGGIVASNQALIAGWLARIPLATQQTKAPISVAVTDYGDTFLPGLAIVDVISANRTTRLDSIITGRDYTTGKTPIALGTEIYLHVYSRLPQYEYYDEWYHAKVGQNAIVTRLKPGLRSRDAPAPIGQFDEEAFGRMNAYSNGTAISWQIAPRFFLQWRDDRSDINDVKFSLLNADNVIRSATGTTAAGGTPDSASADFTTERTQLSIQLKINLAQRERAYVYGQPMLFLGPPPTHKWLIGYLVVWISLNTTEIGMEYPRLNGWASLDENLTPGYTDFYKVIPPIFGSFAGTRTTSIDIPVDTSNLEPATGISLRVWIADLQVPSAAALGMDNPAPSANDVVTGYGIADTICANGFRVIAQKPASQVLWTAFEVV